VTSEGGLSGPLRAALVACGVAGVVGVGVFANFTTVKYPNDGVYYVAAASSLLDTGRHVNATVTPPGPPITRQNGIVYVLAALMRATGRGWPVAYALLVTALWTCAVLAMGRFFGALIGGHKLRESSTSRVGSSTPGDALAFLAFLQYDILNDSTSFMNEAIYLPVLCLVAAQVGRQLIGLRSRAELRTAIARLPRSSILVAVAFLVLGLFFRSQHAVVLAVALVVLALAGRAGVGLALAGAAFGAFAVYTRWFAAPPSDGFLARILAFQSVDGSDLPFAVGLFTSPLSLTKVVPFDHPVALVAGVAMAGLCGTGLARMKQRHTWLATLIALYVAGSLAFLVLLPIEHSRYYAPVNAALVACLAALAPRHMSARRWQAGVLAGVLASGGAVAVYVTSYLAGDKHEPAWRGGYPQLLAHHRYRAERSRDRSLTYSRQPRMAYWVLGVPACVPAPADCADALGRSYDRVVFIGRKDELEGQDGLRGFQISEPVTQPIDGYAAWTVVSAGP
jgi:hypothetical protein